MKKIIDLKKKNENLKTEIDRLNNEMASIYENYNNRFNKGKK